MRLTDNGFLIRNQQHQIIVLHTQSFDDGCFFFFTERLCDRPAQNAFIHLQIGKRFAFKAVLYEVLQFIQSFAAVFICRITKLQSADLTALISGRAEYLKFRIRKKIGNIFNLIAETQIRLIGIRRK